MWVKVKSDSSWDRLQTLSWVLYLKMAFSLLAYEFLEIQNFVRQFLSYVFEEETIFKWTQNPSDKAIGWEPATLKVYIKAWGKSLINWIQHAHLIFKEKDIINIQNQKCYFVSIHFFQCMTHFHIDQNQNS